MRISTTRFFTLVLCLLAISGLLSSSLYAQADANKGQIVGVVLDANGAVIPNASIKARNVATNLTRDLKTNESGQYRLLLLDPGTYEVTAEANGFSPQKVEGVTLTVGAAITLNITLGVAGTATTVEVSESAVSEVQTAPSATVGQTQITNLPINGRRFQDFATLTPTVIQDPSRNQLSFAGQRGINSNVMLDGGDYNQPFFGGIRGGERSGTIITVPQSAIQEFQVVATGYSAEYGRSTGGIMNTITRSGANDVHGEAFWQIRPRDLSAENPIPITLPGTTTLTRVTPSEQLQQYGGSAGGAVKKNRLFWFGAYEGQNADTPRRVFFAPLATLAQTPGNAQALQFFRSQEGPFEQTNRAYATMGRMDYQFEKGHRLTARYNFSDSRENNALSVGGDLNPFSNSALSNEGAELNRIHNGAIQYTHLLSPTTVNDFRFIGSAELRPRLANANLPGVNATLIGQFGTRSFFPTTQSDKRFQIADALSMTRGNHTLKFGFDYNYLTAAQAFGFNQFGFFTVGTAAGVGVAQQLEILGNTAGNRFDNTVVSYSRQIGNTLAAFNMQQIAFFGQDSWRVNRRLSIDYGLRYEAQINPKVDANNEVLLNQVRGFRFPLGSSFDPARIPNNTNQWAPRAGFAWTPFENGPRTVIRGHAGVFYAATPMLVFAGPNNNFRTPPGDVSLTLTPTAGRTIYQAFRAAGLDLNTVAIDNLPLIPLDVVQRASAFLLTGSTTGSGANPFTNASVTGNASDFRNPRSVQFGLGIETEVARGFTLGVQLNYVNTVFLLRNRNFNLGVPTVAAGDLSQRPNFRSVNIPGGQPTIPRPVPGLNVITIRESSARQMYRGMTVQAQWRKKRFQLQTFYTMSENFSNDDSERDAGGFVYVDSFNLRPEYWYSNLDFRHQFLANGTYSLPWGFEVGALFRGRTGFPFNPIANIDLNQDGNNNDRPYKGPGEIYRRNEFRNRGFSTFDTRIMKNFNIGERARVQLSAEFFNLFNTDNVVFAGQGNIFGPGFQANGTFAPQDPRFMRLHRPDQPGVYDALTTTQVGRPRQMQFGARFFF